MRNRIDTRFEQLSAAGRSALIPFVTAGDPQPAWTAGIMHALVAAGADVLELGVPFSDPMADGPVIQAASERAIAKGIGLRQVLDMVRRFREADCDTPVVLMGYLNPIERFAYEPFCAAASAAGVDGLLLVDCPPEEMVSLRPFMDAAGVHPICLVAPTTTPQRMAIIGRQARGYLYYVSFKGITGADRLDPSGLAAPLLELRRHSELPLAVGFGIKDANSAAAVAGLAEGVVIGSALIERLAAADSEADACRLATDFLAPVRKAMDNERQNT